ncbi:MAG: winged helix-turn-helix transcriptional regulator [Lachnospiraceae bacterium]
MKIKLACITTEFLENFFIQTFSSLRLSCNITFYIYHSLDDVLRIYESLPSNTDGIITSGIFPTQALKKRVSSLDIPIASINSDEASIYRLFFSLLEQKRDLDITRIYADPLAMFGIDTLEYLLEDQTQSYSNRIAPFVEQMTLQDLLVMEETQLKQHIDLWNSGKTDISITRFSGIVPRLRELGIPVYFPYPSIQYVDSVCSALLQEIKLHNFKKHQPAVINVCIKSSDGNAPILNNSLEHQCLLLQEALLEFSNIYVMDFIFKRLYNGFEVLTECNTVQKITKQHTVCTLTSFLNDRLNVPFCIGYGIGMDMSQARMHALDANRESYLSTKTASFVINSSGDLFGPLNESPAENTLLAKGVSSSDTKIHLSPITVRKVTTAMESMPSKQITARELAVKLALTPRSANRFLNELEKAGLITVIEKRRSTSKGRPERVYSLTCNS